MISLWGYFAFFSFHLVLARHLDREHDPRSMRAPRAPLQQHPPTPFSHHCLLIITPVFSPLVRSYWNSGFVSASFESLWTAAPTWFSQVQHCNFRFVKLCIFFLLQQDPKFERREDVRKVTLLGWITICAFHKRHF